MNQTGNRRIVGCSPWVDLDLAAAMPDKDQAAKAIDSALESALESVGE